MNGPTAGLESIAEQARQVLAAKDSAREKTLPLYRNVIRNCGQAIRAVHRQEFDSAIRLLNEARQLLDSAGEIIREGADYWNIGSMRDAEKEFAEAHLTLALVKGKPVPGPAELKVDAAAYLNGMGEAVGELRRYLLDAMRMGDLSRGEELLRAMDDIYSVLVTMDFPDAMTGGLRRTTDMVRGVLEKTRGDFTLALRQRELEERLQALASRQRSDTRRPLPPRPSRRTRRRTEPESAPPPRRPE